MRKGKVKGKPAKHARRSGPKGGELGGAALDRVAGRGARDAAIQARMAAVAAAAEAVSAISKASHDAALANIKNLKA
jgi:hypothetical protein